MLKNGHGFWLHSDTVDYIDFLSKPGRTHSGVAVLPQIQLSTIEVSFTYEIITGVFSQIFSYFLLGEGDLHVLV